MPEIPTDALIDGRYKVLTRIGSGGSGVGFREIGSR